ncbi:MAG: oxidative damage protection protein [Myxococcales bacterium]|nr:oxidative damage protection protein [Myxococcales bacterium]MCB9647399.1 oxidative damage protection protein [Deltaproteobacteria bacterium]
MKVERVDVTEAARRVAEAGWRVVDVRSVPEYAEAHAEGAYNVPLLNKTPQGMIPNEAFGPTIARLFPDKGTPLLMMDAMGARSVRATQELMAQGYTQVVDVAGGLNGEYDAAGAQVHAGWIPAGLPTEHGATQGRAYRFLKPETPAPGGDVSQVRKLDEDLPDDAEGVNRFASRRRMVMCAKLGMELPGLKRRPYPGALGERIFNEISAMAWDAWVEHSKMIINEYRINSADPSAIKLLMEQCEAFLFGEGVDRPEGYVPQGH